MRVPEDLFYRRCGSLVAGSIRSFFMPTLAAGMFTFLPACDAVFVHAYAQSKRQLPRPLHRPISNHTAPPAQKLAESAGGSRLGTSLALSQSLQEKLFINVKEFGAKGDGKTNDTPAIQAALNSLPNGGTVLIPSGIYLLQEELKVTANDLKIVGEEGTILRNRGITAPGDKPLLNLQLEQLRIDLGGQGDTKGILLRSVQNSTLDRVVVKNAGVQGIPYTTNDTSGGFGFLFYSSNSVTVRDCRAENIGGGGYYRGDGFYVQGSENVTFERCIADKVGRHGFAVSEGGATKNKQIRYLNCTSSDTALAGIDLEPGSDIHIVNHYFVRCGSYDGYFVPAILYGGTYRLMAGVAMTVGCDNVVIKNSYFMGGHFGITLGGRAKNILIDGNIIRDMRSTPIDRGGLAQSAESVKIINNFIHGRIGDMYAARDWDISGNHLYGDGSGRGLDFNESQRVSIRDNAIFNFNTGIAIRQNAVINFIEGNRIFGCHTPLHLRAVAGAQSPIYVSSNYFSTESATSVTSFSSHAISIEQQTGGSVHGQVVRNTIAGYTSLLSTFPTTIHVEGNVSRNLSTQAHTSLDQVSVTLDFPAIASQSTEEQTIVFPGAKVGESVILGPSSGLEAGLVASGSVLSPDSVRVSVTNISKTEIDPAPNLWRVSLVR